MSALLEVQGLETAYGSSQVLFGIDLQVESGQVAATAWARPPPCALCWV